MEEGNYSHLHRRLNLPQPPQASPTKRCSGRLSSLFRSELWSHLARLCRELFLMPLRTQSDCSTNFACHVIKCLNFTKEIIQVIHFRTLRQQGNIAYLSTRLTGIALSSQANSSIIAVILRCLPLHAFVNFLLTIVNFYRDLLLSRPEKGVRLMIMNRS